MNTQILDVKPWLALSILGGEYVLLGWYLAAHHVFFLIGTSIVVLTVTVIWKKNPLLDFLGWLTTQEVLVVIAVSFFLSLLVAFLYIKPILLSLTLLPLITLLYAILEMRAADFGQVNVLLWAILITGLGLSIGEVIDLFVAPSMRY